MEALLQFLAMGKYGAYVWPAYAIAAVALGGLAWFSVRSLRAREGEVAALEATRRRRRGHGEAAS